MEVLHHHPHEHVKHKEADNEEEGYEVEEHPGVVVGHRLEEEGEQRQLIGWVCDCMEMMGMGPAMVISCWGGTMEIRGVGWEELGL